MAREVKTYYLVNKNGKHSVVELLHYVENMFGAEDAMKLELGLSNEDIKVRTSGSPAWTKTYAVTVFDGRKVHFDDKF